MYIEMNFNNSSMEMEQQFTNESSTTNLLTFLEANRELLDRIFVICLVCLIMLANVLMGCELDLNIVLQTIRRPIAPAIGFFTQFALMPLLAFAISLGIFSTEGEHLLAIGLFVTGCSPGGGASNYWTILLGGNANLSITMTFISTIGAMVMMPIWIRILGAELLASVNPNATVLIPYRKMVASMFSLVLPLLIGLLVAKFRPNWATKMRSWIRPFIISVLLFIITFGVINNFWLLKMITCRIFLAGMLLPMCGFMFGCFCAILFTQKPPNVVAIAIETGVQNTGIAIMVLKLTFPGVQGDMASLLPIVVACCTPIPLLLSYLACKLRRRFRRKAKEPIDDELDSESNVNHKNIEKCEFRSTINSVLILKYTKVPCNDQKLPIENKIICKDGQQEMEIPLSESMSRSSSSQPLISARTENN